MNIFGRRLIKLRIKNKISIASLSKMLNVSTSTITRWENGHSEPMLCHIKMLAIIFNVSADYLIGIDDMPTEIKSHLVFPTLLRSRKF